ncbi:Nedd8 [Acrasis kona]|uniref:Nedd8 n=1 Tax=Acrasis kona TaxID=1008807 RepID=A0AAW2Z7E3_9EUKA
MHFSVNSPNSEPFCVNIETHDLVQYIRDQLHEITSIPQEEIRLFMNDRYLNNNKTLSTYYPKQNSSIKIVRQNPTHVVPVTPYIDSNEIIKGLDTELLLKVIKYLEIKDLVSLSLTNHVIYDLVNKDEGVWNKLATRLNIGDSKIDCLNILWDEFYDYRQDLNIVKDAQVLREKAVQNLYNNKNSVKCVSTQEESTVVVTIINTGSINIRLPFHTNDWSEHISLLVFDAETELYITTFTNPSKVSSTATNQTSSTIILKPEESITTEFNIEGEEADQGIIVVAVSTDMTKHYIKYITSIETNPFSIKFWQDQVKNYDVEEWDGGRFISNTLLFKAPDVYICPSAILLDENECNYTD